MVMPEIKVRVVSAVVDVQENHRLLSYAGRGSASVNLSVQLFDIGMV